MTGSPFLAVRSFNGALLQQRLLHQGLRGFGSFGSGAACQFTPSMVLSTALAVAGVASPSPSHVDQASSYRIAGMRGSSSWDLIVRRMSSLAGTVA